MPKYRGRYGHGCKLNTFRKKEQLQTKKYQHVLKGTTTLVRDVPLSSMQTKGYFLHHSRSLLPQRLNGNLSKGGADRCVFSFLIHTIWSIKAPRGAMGEEEGRGSTENCRYISVFPTIYWTYYIKSFILPADWLWMRMPVLWNELLSRW